MTEDTSFLWHGGGQRILRFCCMGEGEPDFLAPLSLLAPLSQAWERGWG